MNDRTNYPFRIGLAPILTFAFLACLGFGGSQAKAQGPTEPEAILQGDPENSLLGRSPGDARINSLDTNPAEQGFVGAGAGQGSPRVPTSVTQPGAVEITRPPSSALRSPASEPLTDLPVFGPLNLPTLETSDMEGPPDGLSLDSAIEQLVTANLDLRARALELPQGDADILTAGLRSNPFLYYDTQLIPYGKFNDQKPGGQTQYDLNVTMPLDLSRKRKARVRVAVQARRVLEAQYQDAVRLTIGQLYVAYVDALAARETVRYAQASVDNFDKLVQLTQELFEKGNRTSADLSRVKVKQSAAQVGLEDAQVFYRKSKQKLISLLDLAIEDPDQLELRGLLKPAAPALPEYGVLLDMAFASRPDLQAFRIGTERAYEEVRLSMANRFSDVYLLYQPYTAQDNRPEGKPVANSWAIGVTVPLPIFNRNQGNIARARINVDQTRIETAVQERRVKTEVFDAYEEYRIATRALDRLESEILPMAEKVRSDTLTLFTSGELEFNDFVTAQREYNDIVRQYRDSLARHRQAALALNTAVGCRIMP
jgi:cobalt-zinc-cadmium efflux system outer membrane protein